MSTRRLYWFCYQPTPYNSYLFQSLAKSHLFELLVYYRTRLVYSHPWKTDLTQGYEFKFYKTILGLDWQIIFQSIVDKNAFCIIAGWDHPTSILLLTLLRIFGRSYAVWTDTPNVNRKRKRIIAFLRKVWLLWIINGAEKVMGTGAPAVTALKEMGVRPEKIINFPFFLDLNIYKCEKKNCTAFERPLRFLSSGRIQNNLKGHDIALHALYQAKKNNASFSFEYSIAGTGPDEILLKQILKELNIEENVKILGWVEPKSLISLYKQSDVLIHPSPVHDPFPNAVLEGMAAGLVVMSSDTCGSALDRIKHGYNGFIHRAGDVNELGEQIVYLLNHWNEVPEIAVRARAAAEQWPIERGVEIIQEIISVQ